MEYFNIALNNPSLIGGAVLLVLSAWIVYQIYLCPLASFPGPKLNCLSYAPYNYWLYTGQPHLFLQAMHKRYGDIVRVGPKTLSVASVKGMDDVYGFRPVFTKNEFYDTFIAGGSSNMPNIMAEKNEAIHAPLKKILGRCFTSREMKAQESFIQSHVKNLVEKLRVEGARPDGAEVGNWTICYSSDTIGDLALGQSFGSLETGKLHMYPSTFEKFFKAIYIVDMVRRYPLVHKLMKAMMPEGVRKSQLAVAEHGQSVVGPRFEHEVKRADYVSVMIEAGFSPLKVRVNAGILMGAGTETLANSICFSLYALATHREALATLVEELKRTFATAEDISASRTESLPYLNAVIQETLRWLPPLTNAGYRVSPGATVDGRYVPAGTECFSPVWTMSRSSKNFANPNEFRPERWLDKSSSDVKKASAPFALGPRGCIGKDVALFEFRLVLAHVCWSMDFELAKPNATFVEDCRSHFSWNKPDLYMRFMERK